MAADTFDRVKKIIVEQLGVGEPGNPVAGVAKEHRLAVFEAAQP